MTNTVKFVKHEICKVYFWYWTKEYWPINPWNDFLLPFSLCIQLDGSEWILQWFKTAWTCKEKSNSCAGVSASVIILISLEQSGKSYYFGNYEFVLGLKL